MTLSPNGIGGEDVDGNSYSLDWEYVHSHLFREKTYLHINVENDIIIEEDVGSLHLGVIVNTNFSLFIELQGDGVYEELYFIFNGNQINVYNIDGEKIDDVNAIIDGCSFGGNPSMSENYIIFTKEYISNFNSLIVTFVEGFSPEYEL